MSEDGLFAGVDVFPDIAARARYDGLVGLDDVKRRLLTEGTLLLRPSELEDWSRKTHRGKVIGAVAELRDRTPLFVFGGDVGTGKTELAETFGSALAEQLKIRITLYRLSLSTRGTGRVGEMTQLIAAAFGKIEERLAGQAGADAPSSAAVLVIDEADALAQSRELAQMHHEDRAGVNALIRGISRVAAQRLPVLIVMCTNRTEALDPAVMRRAAAVFAFQRPNDEQRAAVLARALEHVGITDQELRELVSLTGATADRGYGFTYSDLRHRLIPAAVVDAFPEQPITTARLIELLVNTPPTAPFSGA